MRLTRRYLMIAAITLMLGATGTVTRPMSLELAETLLLVQDSSTQKRYVVRVPEEFPTIQAALDAVAEGGIVLLGPGVYKENLTITKSVRLVGAGQERVQLLGDSSAGPAYKIISFFSRSTLQVSLQDLTIGDPTFPIEQVFPPTPTSPKPSGIGLWILFAPVQMVLRRVTIGGLFLGAWSSQYYDQGVALPSQIVLEEANLRRNFTAISSSGQLRVIRSKIEENLGGISMVGGQLTLSQSSVSRNRDLGVGFFRPSNPYAGQEFIGYIVGNEFKQNGVGVALGSSVEGDWIVIANNRFVENERYGVVIEDPACPIFPEEELPVLKSAPIRIFGGGNEFHNNGQDLCPPDYPWPPGFRK